MSFLGTLPYVVGCFLLGTFLLQIFSPSFLKRSIRWILLGAFLAIISFAVCISVLQYRAFQAGFLGQTIHTTGGISWFLGYVRFHYWNTYLVSFIVGLLLIFFAQYAHKKRGRVFFEDEELYVASLGIFLVGYPGILVYIPAMLLLPAIASALFLKKGERMPLYYFWMPVAFVLVLFIDFWAINQTWWLYFRF